MLMWRLFGWIFTISKHDSCLRREWLLVIGSAVSERESLSHSGEHHEVSVPVSWVASIQYFLNWCQSIYFFQNTEICGIYSRAVSIQLTFVYSQQSLWLSSDHPLALISSLNFFHSWTHSSIPNSHPACLLCQIEQYSRALSLKVVLNPVSYLK